MNKISIIKEKMQGEKRVILMPKHVKKLIKNGYEVTVEKGAGESLGFVDSDYRDAGAEIATEREAWLSADLIIKYKPPIESEYQYIKEGIQIAALCHAEGNYPLMREFIKKKCTVFSYEFFKSAEDFFPLALAGGEIAGKVAMIYAMFYAQTQFSNFGKIPVNVNSAESVTIGVIGYGNVGSSIIKMALDLGNNVIVFGKNIPKLKKLSIAFGNKIKCCECNSENLYKELLDIDILFGAILISTFDTPPIVTEDMINVMKEGSIIIDVTCGYGKGYMPFFERETSLKEPVYYKNGKTFIKINNLPCAYHRTTTEAYSNNAYPYIEKLCDFVFRNKKDEIIENGKLFENGKIVHKVIQEHYEYYERNNL